jgi:predicted nuclease with TOPRIM domain
MTVITFAQRLRTENRLLRQRVELLEAESSELADRLVRGQVSRAEEEETTFVVQRELAALRHTHLETSHRLEIAQEEIRNLSLLMEETVSLTSFALSGLVVSLILLCCKEIKAYDVKLFFYPFAYYCVCLPATSEK